MAPPKHPATSGGGGSPTPELALRGASNEARMEFPLTLFTVCTLLCVIMQFSKYVIAIKLS
jgi:hypothetical protein